ncbi:FHF complex subunit HOOK interacting protein 2A isoform X2 [Nematostella vectensis]|uniref:FHF complex subunit HOOK interacting protein 2A isoform X2 n=1 Tax=Nematostella vectensis TaxID=45351 RepID=UPI00207730C5|nr:FHF complex subunit HOOK interacting protein 2A isoform X2 [Nematostella vectensis]
MFSKIKSLVQEAVEALAPEAPQESFVFHWKAVTNYFIEATDEKLPVFSTNIPYHLEKMLETLRREEEQMEGGSTGPCLEYLLQHKILDTLHTLARADCPPGMKQQVLSFFSNLLAKMKQPLLPHVNVYRPVHRLIRLCGEVQAAPSENEEVHFLCTVCSKLRQDPYLVNFFLELSFLQSCSCIACQQTNKDSPPSSTLSPDNNSAINDESKDPVEPRRRDKPDYTLVNSLLALTKSEDSRISVKACEGLMLCASLPEDHAATVIVLYTPFCEIMADKLKPLFDACPPSDPADITTVAAKWGFDHIGDEDAHTFPGKRQLLSFLSWLDYVDQLSNVAHKLVANALAVGVRERFLQPVIEQSLMQQSEIGVISTMALMRRSLSLITSQHLLKEFSMFLLGESKKPEAMSDTGEHKLRQKLIELCDHLSDELSIETLKLFETLIQKPSQVILENLVTRNLTSRKYYDTTTVTNGNASSNETTSSAPASPMTPLTPTIDEVLGLPGSVDEADRQEVERVVNSFLSLVPNEVKSSLLTGDAGYDTYLRDAHQQCTKCALRSRQFDWPTSPLPVEGDDTREHFYPGAFLGMLFRKLERLLDQPYEVNLQVTSVLSLLAQFTHPHLHEFLLCTHLPLVSGCSSLYHVLQGVVTDLRDRIERIPNFQRSVVTIRRQLMGLSIVPEHKSTAHRNLLEACIVLEEFCKELAAIAFVKATASLRD